MKYLFIVLFGGLSIFGHTQSSNKVVDFQSTPTRVLEEVFRAAQTGDYSNLHLLCPPDKTNDGDTQQYICDISEGTAEQKAEFKAYFEKAYITDKPNYSSESDPREASIQFWFNHPGGESRSNETMNFVKIEDKWYLTSF